MRMVSGVVLRNADAFSRIAYAVSPSGPSILRNSTVPYPTSIEASTTSFVLVVAPRSGAPADNGWPGVGSVEPQADNAQTQANPTFHTWLRIHFMALAVGFTRRTRHERRRRMLRR